MNAIPQLTRTTPASGTSLKRRCPYPANVMSRLEARRSRTGVNLAERAMAGMQRESEELRGEPTIQCPIFRIARPHAGTIGRILQWPSRDSERLSKASHARH